MKGRKSNKQTPGILPARDEWLGYASIPIHGYLPWPTLKPVPRRNYRYGASTQQARAKIEQAYQLLQAQHAARYAAGSCTSRHLQHCHNCC